MANLKGNLKELTITNGDNKRTQVVSLHKEEQVNNTKKETVNYVPTRLKLPEDLKRKMDILFIENKQLKKKGKNIFMIEAIDKELKRYSL